MLVVLCVVLLCDAIVDGDDVCVHIDDANMVCTCVVSVAADIAMCVVMCVGNVSNVVASSVVVCMQLTCWDVDIVLFVDIVVVF